MITPAARRRTTGSLRMHRIILAAYTVTAAAVAVAHLDSVWLFVLHGAGAAAGVCALAQAIHYAGLIGRVHRDLYGPIEDGEEEQW